jgi:hypothetical protein
MPDRHQYRLQYWNCNTGIKTGPDIVPSNPIPRLVRPRLHLQARCGVVQRTCSTLKDHPNQQPAESGSEQRKQREDSGEPSEET